MAGNRKGGLAVKQKILEKDAEFYVKIGRMGGVKGRTGGFYANPGLASIAGAKGGRKSRRGPAKPKHEVANS